LRAGYLLAPGRVEVREVDVPQPEAGGLVVRVRVALTDGTDLKAFRRGHPQMPMPTRFGHEFSGDVAAVGAGVEGFAAGDPIMSVHSAPDGTCYWCLRGQEELCESVMETKILGAYAEFVALPPHIVRRNAFRKPAGVSYEAAAFLEPLACVVHSLNALAPQPGDLVAVIGDGGFGILHALALRARGARPVLVGRRPERLALARALGVTDILDARAGDIAEALRRGSDGRGADAVVESTGARDVWEAAPSFVRRGGTVLLFGGLPGGTRVEFDAARLHYDEIKLVSPFHFTPRAVREAHDLLASHLIDVVPIISERFTLDRLGEAFDALAAGGGVNLKYAIVP
jgi:L-iditol 2-dehydrogenase